MADRSLTYADWTERLCGHFFRPDRSGQPVTFFVDDELLGRLEGSDDPVTGVTSLTEAVKRRLTPDGYGRRFTGIDAECIRWKVNGGEGCPPSLPLLAVAVLAATRMAREEGIAPNNYWRRFRDLFNFQQQDLKGINEVLPDLWHQLTWWLDEKLEGNLGRSTVQDDPWWTIIGYALSQALFRESDRQRLTEFFRRIGLSPGEQVDASEMLQYFKAWAPISGLSVTAKEMAQDSRFEQRLKAILSEEATQWDGVLRDERGRKLGSLLLTFEPVPQPVYRIVAERPSGFPSTGDFTSTLPFTIRLTESAEGWYAESWPLEPDWLSSGLRIRCGNFILSLRASQIIPLEKNRELGCWASISRIQPSEEHCVLADASVVDTVERYLRAHARTGWKRAQTAFAPQGWVLFTDVVIEATPEEEVGGPLAMLVPSLRERPTLRGGLLLDSSLSLYLTGGEPDLWLPSLLVEGTEASVDGRILRERPGQRISLRDLGLHPGSHEIVVGDSHLRFTSVEALRTRDAPGTASVVHMLRRSAAGYQAVSSSALMHDSSVVSPEVAVSGGCLIGNESDLPRSRETLLLPLGATEYVLLGSRPGEISIFEQPSRPSWMTSVGRRGLFPIGFEVYPQFDVVWVVIYRTDRKEIRLRTARPPSSEPLPDEAADRLALWRGQFQRNSPEDDEGQRLWSEYLAVAERLDPDKATPS